MSSFQDYDLRSEILESIATLGFEKPTDIQAKTIPFLLESHQDLIALAQTGTGKTAGFGLPIINQVDTNVNNIQANEHPYLSLYLPLPLLKNEHF